MINVYRAPPKPNSKGTRTYIVAGLYVSVNKNDSMMIRYKRTPSAKQLYYVNVSKKNPLYDYFFKITKLRGD